MNLSILSWNVEHFNGRGGTDEANQDARGNRVAAVIKEIRKLKPDVFGLSEVVGVDVHQGLTKELPEYAFHITEGKQSQELLIGVSREHTSFFRQLDQFKERNPWLRPGALLTITRDDVHVPILFVHFKSTRSPNGFGLRDMMFSKILKLKTKLDEKAAEYSKRTQANANFIVVGDMNTMGLNYYRDNDIAGETEIKYTLRSFNKKGMRALKKSHDLTYNGGSGSRYPPSDLDHVFAADHLEFQAVNADGDEVEVGGWALKNESAEQDAWVKEYSDHAPLVFKLCGFNRGAGEA